MDAVEKHGHSWKDVQTKYYPGRSANSVKNRSVLRVDEAVARALTRDWVDIQS